MCNIHPVGGAPGGECYLVTTGHSALLVDTGFAYSARETVRRIRSVLRGRPLDRILLTHSHYDHVGGCAVVKAAFPAAKVVASAHTQAVAERKNARRTMRALDDSAARIAGMPPQSASTDQLYVDVTVGEDDCLKTEDLTIRVLETPGHTRCSVSFYLEEESLLIASETTGVAVAYPDISPGFIIGYQMSMDALERCSSIGAKRLLLPHSGALEGKNAVRFFQYSRQAAEHSAAFIVERSQQGLTNEEIVQAYKDAFFDEKRARVQPEAAFLLNTRAIVPRLLDEFRKSGRLVRYQP